MVFVEQRKKNENIYYYHCKNFRLNSKVKKLSIYIGKDKSIAYDFSKIKESIKELSKREVDLTLENYKLEGLTFSNDLVNTCLFNSITFSQIKQYDRNFSNKIDFLFNLNFIYNSNSIEGSRISIEEVNNILKSKKTNHRDKNEIQEVLNSMECQKYFREGFRFNLSSIKKLHKILTKDLFENGKPYVQGFKKRNIVVGFDARETTSPGLVKSELEKLFEWYKESKKKEFSLKLAFEFYFRFELIHPFEDGNGRIGRMLMNKILEDLNLMPIIIFTQNSESHHRAFVRGEKGNMKYYYDFMFKQYRKTFENFYFNEFEI